MTADEMVIVARLADHYEARGCDGDPLVLGEHDLRKVQHEAPVFWAHVWANASLSSREVGDRLYAFIQAWSRSGMSFKNFAADWADEHGPRNEEA